jgi:hypothetical protein
VNCAICSQQGLQLAGNATCVECGIAVCVRPPQRRDKVFHGDRCTCGCSHFVCETDLVRHARKHGGTPTSCFGYLAMSISLGAWGTSSAPAGGVSGPTSSTLVGPADVVALNRFLNCVTPGHEALGGAVRRLLTTWPTDARGTVEPDAAFYTQARLRRVGSLAQAACRQTAQAPAMHGLLVSLPPLTRLHFTRVLGVSSPPARGADALDPEDARWVGDAISDWMQRETMGGAKAMGRVTIHSDVLQDAGALAEWVVDGAEGDRDVLER